MLPENLISGLPGQLDSAQGVLMVSSHVGLEGMKVEALSASGSSSSRGVGSWVSAQFRSGCIMSGSTGSWDWSNDIFPSFTLPAL